MAFKDLSGELFNFNMQDSLLRCDFLKGLKLDREWEMTLGSVLEVTSQFSGFHTGYFLP